MATFIDVEPIFELPEWLGRFSRAYTRDCASPEIQIGWIRGWNHLSRRVVCNLVNPETTKLVIGYRMQPLLPWVSSLVGFRTATCIASFHQFSDYTTPNEFNLTVWYRQGLNFNFSEPDSTIGVGQWLALNIHRCMINHWGEHEWDTNLDKDGKQIVRNRKKKFKTSDFINPKISGRYIFQQGPKW